MSFPFPLIILVGLISGGIINWLADDLPHHRMPRAPRYPDGALRPPVAWLGVLAFLTGRRASPGGAHLSWRYPITEIGTIFAMLLANAAAVDNAMMSETRLTFWLIYMAIFVLVTVIDIEHKLILFSVIIPSALIALIDAAFEPLGPSLVDALIGGAVGFGVFFLMYLGGYLFTYMLSKARGRQINEIAFGYGDVMLITLSGLILGWQPLIFAMFITVFLGAAGAVVYIASRSLAGGRYSMFTALPYGPYIIVATTIMLLFAGEVIRLLT